MNQRQQAALEENNYRNDVRVRAGSDDTIRDSYYMVEAQWLELSVKSDGVEAWNEAHDYDGCGEGEPNFLLDVLPLTPGPWEVCDLCLGNGKVANPSIDCNGLTRDDFAEDPDFAEEYFSGVYDVQCPECRGVRVLRSYEPAPGKLHAMTTKFLEIVDKAIADQQEYEDECWAERRAEMMMGC